MKIDPSEYIRIGTAATIAGVTRAYLRRIVKSGKMRHVAIDGIYHVRRVDAESLRKRREAARNARAK